MDSLPSLEEMGPDEWVSAMRDLREEVVEDTADVLDVRTRPESAAQPLQQVLDRFNNLDVGLQQIRADSAAPFSLEVRYQDDMLSIWASPTEDYESLVYTRDDYWWFDHSGVADPSRPRHDIHCDVARRLVSLLAWSDEDDLLEIAAIEMGSRAGE